jgi:hypothetical protein
VCDRGRLGPQPLRPPRRRPLGGLARSSRLERSILQSYARLAASALDSEASISEARQQATTAHALLSLSSSLADLASTEEMILRLGHAVPSVVDCDRVAIWVTDPRRPVGQDERQLRLRRGLLRRAVRFELPPAYANDNSEVFHHDLGITQTAALSAALSAAGAVAALSFPIIYDSEMYGWITIDVTDHPERLDDNATSPSGSEAWPGRPPLPCATPACSTRSATRPCTTA